MWLLANQGEKMWVFCRQWEPPGIWRWLIWQLLWLLSIQEWTTNWKLAGIIALCKDTPLWQQLFYLLIHSTIPHTPLSVWVSFPQKILKIYILSRVNLTWQHCQNKKYGCWLKGASIKAILTNKVHFREGLQTYNLWVLKSFLSQYSLKTGWSYRRCNYQTS